MREEWRAVAGHVGYDVSSSGRVRSITRLLPRTRNGKTWLYKICGRILKHTKCPDGYARIKLAGGRQVYVHTLVATEFLGWRKGQNVLHLNGKRNDNRLGNLLCVSPSIRALNRVSKTSRLQTTTYSGFRAIVWVNGKHRNLGTFNSQQEAQAARNALVDRMLADATQSRITRCARA